MANYSRFYVLLGRLAYDGDREELKESLVGQFTGGRSVHVRDMSPREYDALCEYLDAMTCYSRTMRRKRSQCLHLMQRLGINTSDWNRVNLFCQDARIAGKVFARLSIEELEALRVKLRAIDSKGGLSRVWSELCGVKDGADGRKYMLVGGQMAC